MAVIFYFMFTHKIFLIDSCRGSYGWDEMLCRLNRHYTSQYLLPYRPEGVYNNIHQPDWPPDSKDIAVPLATLILALTPRWTLLANLILRVSCSHW